MDARRITNIFLGIISLCLMMLTAKIYHFNEAYGAPQQVTTAVLVYYDNNDPSQHYKPVAVDNSGRLIVNTTH